MLVYIHFEDDCSGGDCGGADEGGTSGGNGRRGDSNGVEDE